MNYATIMKEALEAVSDAECRHEGAGLCECCGERIKPANDGLVGLEDATVARMDWAAELEPRDLARIVKALEVAEAAAERFGLDGEVKHLRRLLGGLEDLP